MRSPLLAVCAILLVAYVILHLWHLGGFTATLGRPALILLVIATLALQWLVRYALRERERLADAAASLCVDPSRMKLLTGRPKDTPNGLAPLEYLVASLTPVLLPGQAFLGLKVRAELFESFFSWLAARRGLSLAEFRFKLLSRLRRLRGKALALSRNTAPNLAASCLAGVTGGLLLVALFSPVSYFLLDQFLVREMHDSTTRLRGTWSYDVAAMNSLECLEFAFLCVPGIVAIFVLGVALRSIGRLGTLGSSDPRKVCLTLTPLLTVVFGVAAGVFVLVSLAMHPATQMPGHLVRPVVMLGFWMVLGTWGLVCTWYLAGRDYGSWRASTMRVLVLIAVVSGALTWFWATMALPTLTNSGRLLLLMGIWVTIGLLMLSRFWRSFYWCLVLPQECLGGTRILKRQFLWYEPVETGRRMSWKAVLASALGALIMLVLPVLAATSALGLWLNELDTRYFASFGELLPGGTTGSPLAVSASPSSAVAVGWDLRGIYLLARFMEPLDATPSTTVGMLALGLSAVLGLPAILTYFLGTSRRKGHWRDQASSFLELCQLTGQSHLVVPHLRRWFEIGPGYIRSTQPFVRSLEGLPMTRLSCLAAQWPETVGFNDQEVELLLTWIKQCEKPGGGFGATPTLEADLVHTVSALAALERHKLLKSGHTERHELWLRRSLEQVLDSPKPGPPSLWLHSVRLCVEGLSHTGFLRAGTAGSLALARRLIPQVEACWQASARTPRDTRNVIQTLNELGQADAAVQMEIRTSWLPERESRLVELHPRAADQEILHTLKVIRILFPQDFDTLPAVSQVKDNMAKAFSRQGTFSGRANSVK
jgi:hypothetical protein